MNKLRRFATIKPKGKITCKHFSLGLS